MSVTRVGSGPLAGAVSEPLVERFERGVVDGDGSFVVDLAERDPQPGAVGAVVDEVVELEIEQLADAQPGVAQHGDADAGEPVLEPRDGGHDRGVDVGRERAWQRLGLARDVGVEHQPSSWRVSPAPRGDVVQEGAHGDGGMGVHVRADGSGPVVAASAGSG
jgi:hypothetical protein